MNLARWLDFWARERPARIAIRFEGAAIDYATLARDTRAAARLLSAAGITRGDRIAWLGFNHPQLVVLLFAAARIGAIVAPLNHRLAPAEHAYQLADSAPKLLIHESSFDDGVVAATRGLPPITCRSLEHDWLPALCATSNDDAVAMPTTDATEAPGRFDDDLLLVYTSGTTGRPKGALLTQSALQWNAINSIHAHDLTADDHVLMGLPLFHVGGLNIMFLPALHVGATTTLMPRFEPGAFLALVESVRPTLTLLVPATIGALLAHPAWAGTDLASLRMVNTGSSIVPVPLLQAWHTRGVPAGQVYGSTETAPIAICLRAEDTRRKIGSAGRPAMFCEARLVTADGHVIDGDEVGEIQIRGPNVMRAYHGDPAATAQAFDGGWFRTGDLARRDGDGFYWVVGRSRELIISGGENIYPAELEQVLIECPAVAEAVVVGEPDARWGEQPVAVVVLRAGASISESEVLSLFDGRLAKYKWPRRVVFVDTLPKTALGKVQRGRVVESLGTREDPPA